jgi:hypothetical protein
MRKIFSKGEVFLLHEPLRTSFKRMQALSEARFFWGFAAARPGLARQIAMKFKSLRFSDTFLGTVFAAK